MDNMIPNGRKTTIAIRLRNVMRARVNREVCSPLFPLGERTDESEAMLTASVTPESEVALST